jgi:sterol desaturase/sphingolipid hydroxylase (fatty acid hydroxylase superfamily)
MNNEVVIRVGSFVTVFILIALWEIVARRRSLTTSKKERWFSNLGIISINTLVVRLIFPVLAVNMAIKAQQSGWGFLNNSDLPFWLAFVIGIVALDLTIYLQHVMFHAIPTLWRLHMMHHADLDYDLTTGLRFHPLEMILSMGINRSTIKWPGHVQPWQYKASFKH